ncbi:M17 family metallopeptidase [Mycoplasma buteonis]|uniref:M17 family metallopeptidase n=1 Tax=Mycoplasma buteonis TaxID=171280 RepID=UPI00056B38F2|nr:M17 family metallopeptidase [Mycoplasma buteonis]
MKILNNKNLNYMLIRAAYENGKFPEFVARKNLAVTEDLQNNIAYVYIDKKHSNLEGVTQVINKFASSLNRNYAFDLKSFITENLSVEELIRLFIIKSDFATAKLFKKTIEKSEKNEKSLALYLNQRYDAELIKKAQYLSRAISKVRNLQIMPENFLNSEILASLVSNDFSGIDHLKTTVLTKKEITDLNMGLLLSVNKGSTHEPRVVIAEYKGNPDSEEKIAIVGKGITFDTGGVNTKGYHMDGMKYDMSGSVIAAYAVKVLALLKAKVNVAAVMCITDNRINADASLPENVYQSMSGKWVEVVDTDAEGRLVLADGLYYAATKLKATTLIDVATLTGSILVALGNVYSGIWSTNDAKWETFNKAAQIAQEKVWRMPMHEDYNKGNKGSKVADLASWSKTVRVDSSQAAMFLKEFTNGVDYIHCDVAGTADRNGEPQGELVSTLVEYCLLNQSK